VNKGIGGLGAKLGVPKSARKETVRFTIQKWPDDADIVPDESDSKKPPNKLGSSSTIS